MNQADKEWIEAEALRLFPTFWESHNRDKWVEGATAYATRTAELKQENEKLADDLKCEKANLEYLMDEVKKAMGVINSGYTVRAYELLENAITTLK